MGREVQEDVGSPWRARRRPTVALPCPHMEGAFARVLTWGMAWTEPSTTPRCQVGGDTPHHDVSGALGLGAGSAGHPPP